jgi:hypothetical protein
MTGCISNYNCDTSSEVCNTNTNQCVYKNAVTPTADPNYCTADGQCTANGSGVCVNSSCHYYVQDEGQSCGPNGGTDWNYCIQNVNLICTNFKTALGDGTCVKVCQVNDDCASGRFCSKSSSAANYGVCKNGCRSSSDCTNGKYCRLDTGACLTCQDSSQCAAGQYCNGYGQCTAVSDFACALNV